MVWDSAKWDSVSRVEQVAAASGVDRPEWSLVAALLIRYVLVAATLLIISDVLLLVIYDFRPCFGAGVLNELPTRLRNRVLIDVDNRHDSTRLDLDFSYR